MIFSSLTFLFAYLPITLALYFLVPLRWRNLVLLVVSLFFYGWGEPVYILIMILSILIDYSHGLLVEKYRADDRKARWFVGQSVVFNLLLLGFFKYWDFLADNLFLLTGLVLPESLSVFGYTIPLRGNCAAHRHFVFHVPDHELHHRCLPAGCAGAAEHGEVRGLRHHVPAADRRSHRAV